MTTESQKLYACTLTHPWGGCFPWKDVENRSQRPPSSMTHLALHSGVMPTGNTQKRRAAIDDQHYIASEILAPTFTRALEYMREKHNLTTVQAILESEHKIIPAGVFFKRSVNLEHLAQVANRLVYPDNTYRILEEASPISSAIFAVMVVDTVLEPITNPAERVSPWHMLNNYAVVARRTVMLENPIPTKGALGFWSLPPELLEQVRAEYANVMRKEAFKGEMGR